MGIKVKPKHWWYHITQRKELKVMQALADLEAPRIEKAVQKAYTDMLLYGHAVIKTKWEHK